MNCKICNTTTTVIFNRKVLNKYAVNFHQCMNCGFIQTDEPFWLDEAYKNPINLEDTGLTSRNLLFSKRASTIIYYLFNRNKSFVDFAGGYGLFVRLMRDYGFDFYWTDPFTPNLFAKGFEFNPTIHGEIEVVTAFECFEHFVDPIIEIEKILNISKNILFSTEIFPFEAPNPDKWVYYSFFHGQHIAFYSYKSLRTIAQKYNLNLYSNGKSFHLFTPKKLSNKFYNLLLFTSLLGLSSLTKLLMQSKVHSDSNLLQQNKNV